MASLNSLIFLEVSSEPLAISFTDWAIFSTATVVSSITKDKSSAFWDSTSELDLTPMATFLPFSTI